MRNIPLREAQILWRSPTGPLPAAKVVVHAPDTHLSGYHSWGACDRAFRDATDDERLDLLLRQFIYLTVCEALDPFELHLTLMDIPEYRDAMAAVATIDGDLVALWQTCRRQPNGGGRRADD